MIKFKFVDIGEGLHQGNVAEVHIKVGDLIKEGDPLFSVETDKLTSDIPSPADGEITKVLVEEGKEVHVGDVVVWIDDGKEDSQSQANEKSETKEVIETTKKEKPLIINQEKNAGKKYQGTIDEKYDVIVVGAGPAGYIAAEEAGKNGKKTLIIEKKYWGGVCLNIGCIPTKALLHAAHELKFAERAAQSGIIANFQDLKIDYQKSWINIHKRKDKVVKQIVNGVKFLMQASKVKTLEAEAHLVGAHEIKANGKVYYAPNIIWATGSRDRQLTLPGFEKGYQKGIVWTSKEAINFDKKRIKSLVIIGGGVIGLEFAQIFNAAQTKVTIIQNTDSILSPNISSMIKRVLTSEMEKNGVKFIFNASVEKLEGKKIFYSVNDQQKSIEADHILTSVGRLANTQGLEEIGVAFDQRGKAILDQNFMTSVQGFYLAGDVNARAMLAHVAYRHSYEIINHILRLDSIYTKQAIPGAIYTHPEIAFAGLSEKELKEQNYQYLVGRYNFGFLGRAIATEEVVGLIELYVNKENGELLGAQIIGANASDYIAELVLAMDNEISIFEIAATIHPHPSYSEIIWEAARGVAAKLQNLIKI